MAINLNPKDVRKVNVSTKGLPKTITGKNDRVKMVQGLEHGHTYKVGVKVIYNDWTEYNTTFTIVRILENRTVVEVKDNGERFGTFVLNLNSLITNSIKGKVQEQSAIYYKHMEQMQADFDKKLDEEKRAADGKITTWKKAYEREFKRSNDLTQKYTEQGFELMNVQTALDNVNGAISHVRKALKESRFNKRVSDVILKQVRFATIKGIKEEDIARMIESEIDKRVNEILDNIQK